MKILVTGGAGFIGSHLIKRLLSDGHSVVNVDNLNEYYDPQLKRDRLAQFAKPIAHHELDIADLDALSAIFTEHKFDTICHLAAQAGVRYSIENPHVYARSNYVGTLNVFELAKQHSVPHVVFASTSSVYGKNTKMPYTETDPVDHPVSIYSASKRACELLAHSYNHLFDLNISCLRFFTVYGPWGRPDMAFFKFTKAIIDGETIDVYNEGKMSRDFTYVDDIVDGIVRTLGKPNGFAVYNLGNGSPVELMDFIKAIENAVGKEATKEFKPLQPGDVLATWADITKAKSELGYQPTTDVQTGINKFVEWYREYYKKA